MSFFSKKSSAGFTFIEMIVIITIIGILSGLTIVSFQGNEKRREVENQALLILDGIKRMQTSALSGDLVGVEMPIGYRFEVDECSTGCHYDLIASTTDALINIDSVLLQNSVVDIVDESDAKIADTLMINILPPRGKITFYVINGGSLSEYLLEEVIIKVKHVSDASIYNKITINRISGRMDIFK